MRKRIIAALVAGGLLVAAAIVSVVISSPTTASAQEGEEDAVEHAHRGFDLLDEVLTDLVGQGIIDQGQADAIAQAVEDKAEALKEERQAERELLRDLFEDGVLTSEEAEQLRADHPLLSDQYDEAWEDGELTRDEIRHGRGFRRGFRHGFRLGGIFNEFSIGEDGIDQAEWDHLLSRLPEDHPLADADVSGYLEDGSISADELRELIRGLRADDDAAA